jgi:hypothetical protein
MAILSALLSALVRKLGDILQAIFGWSITALFGKLPPAKQTGLTVALALSIAWPVLVLGSFVPAAAAWALAFLPLQKWMSDGALRAIWIVLAVVVPLVVGGITRWITPPSRLHGGALRTLLGGYSLTLGYLFAFLITAIAVPIVKLLSLMKGWADTHVYVQPREGRYSNVLGEIAAACAAAGQEVVTEPVPGAMALATNTVRWFARGVVDPMVAEQPKRLRGAKVEAYLYPADLLLRGEAVIVARVRAAMTRTTIEQHAYLVEEPDAKEIEDEIQAMWEVIARHTGPGEIGVTARARVREIAAELDRVSISFETWTMLEASLRRVERAIAGGPSIIDAEAGPDTRAVVAVARRHDPDVATTDLVATAIAEAKELAQLEVALAKDEAKRALRGATRAAIFFAVAVFVELVALGTLAATMTTVVAMPVAIAVAAALAAIAIAAGAIGAKKIPKRAVPVAAERAERMEQDVKDAIEHATR